MESIESEFPKQCTTCAREHSRGAWQRLPYKGVQADEVEAAELRNCPCGSTLAVRLRGPASEDADTESDGPDPIGELKTATGLLCELIQAQVTLAITHGVSPRRLYAYLEDVRHVAIRSRGNGALRILKGGR